MANVVPDVLPLLPDGGGFICYTPEDSKCGFGTTPEEAKAAWEQGLLEELDRVAMAKLRERGYL